MIDFSKFSREDLYYLGIRFREEEDADGFIAMIEDEMATRMAKALLGRLPRERMEELDRCGTEEELQAWVEENCPDYLGIAVEQCLALEREILRNRSRIPGTIPFPDIGGTALEDCGLSGPTCLALRKAGFATIGEVAACTDSARLKDLGGEGRKEVEGKLWELIYRYPFTREELWEAYR